MTPIKKNLTTTDLKLIALSLMVLDHIHFFFAYTGIIPFWFTMLGRISLPLFMFCLAEGFCHTRDRKRYLLRLFTAFLIMEASRHLLMAVMPRPDRFVITNNIFGTMFLAASAIYCLDKLWLHRNNIGHLLAYCTLLFAIIPLSFFVEGGWFWVAMGVILYYTRPNRLAQAIDYIVFSLLFWGKVNSCQWLMVFAAPIMLLYSGQKGRGYKYFFYAFYSLHIWILYILSTALYGILAPK
jgi:hypothetical protein